MSRESVIFLLGALIFIMPHLGIPETWKFYFFSVGGVLCMVCGYTLRRRAYLRSIEGTNGERQTDSFSEQGGGREKVTVTSSMHHV